MRTLILEPSSAGLEEILERRRRSGIHRERPRGVWFATAAIVVEVVSPGDESWEKLPFYARQGVDEVLIVDPHTRDVHWLALSEGRFEPIERSTLVDLGPADLAARIDWPPTT